MCGVQREGSSMIVAEQDWPKELYTVQMDYKGSGIAMMTLD